MAVEAIGATGASTTTNRTEFQRFQQRIQDELAAKTAERTAAREKAYVSETDTQALQTRQASGTTAADIGRIGSALDLVI